MNRKDRRAQAAQQASAKKARKGKKKTWVPSWLRLLVDVFTP